jgi:hypothetical protein
MIVVTAAMALGAVDSAQFATQNRKRARQSLSVAAVWAGGFTFSLLPGHGAQLATVAIAGVLTLGAAALLIIHLRHGIATPRVWLAPVVAAIAFVFAVVNL